MPLDPDASVTCPGCGAVMIRGSVSVSQGMVWRRNTRSGGRDFAEDLPGTHAVLRPNRLPAWRCAGCELVLVRYGRKIHRHFQREDDAAIADILAAREKEEAEAKNRDEANPDAPSSSA